MTNPADHASFEPNPPPAWPGGPAPLASPPRTPAPPKGPRLWTPFVAAGVAMTWVVALSVVVGVVAAIVVGLERPDRGTLPVVLKARLQQPAWALPVMAMTSLGVLAAAIVPALLSPVRFATRLSLGPGWAGSAVHALSIGATVGASTSAGALISLLGLGKLSALGEMERFLAGLSGVALIATVVSLGVLAPVGEELLFRGYVQTRFLQAWTPRRAILTTSCMFGIIHLDPVQGAFAMGIGVLLGWIAYRAGSIRPAMSGHLVNNVISVLTGALLPGPSPWPADLSAVLLGAALAALCIVALARRLHRRGSPP